MYIEKQVKKTFFVENNNYTRSFDWITKTSDIDHRDLSNKYSNTNKSKQPSISNSDFKSEDILKKFANSTSISSSQLYEQEVCLFVK